MLVPLGPTRTKWTTWAHVGPLVPLPQPRGPHEAPMGPWGHNVLPGGRRQADGPAAAEDDGGRARAGRNSETYIGTPKWVQTICSSSYEIIVLHVSDMCHIMYVQLFAMYLLHMFNVYLKKISP